MDSLMRLIASLLVAEVVMAASLIDDSSNIAVVSIQASKPEPWIPGSRQTKTRSVELEIAVERVLKGGFGALSQSRITVQQTEPGPRVTAVPGAWSGKAIDRGARYIVFSRADLNQVHRVEPKEALAEVEYVLKAAKLNWSVAEFARNAPKPVLGPIAGEYVLERIETLYQGGSEADAFFALLESAETPDQFRRQMLLGTFAAVTSGGTAPDEFSSRLAVTGFRVAANYETGNLRHALLSTFLPNLLGLKGGAPTKTADQVFRQYPADRDTARSIPDLPESLSSWLDNSQ
jgi:hypothetical protein